MSEKKPIVIGFCAYSGTGKTTLLAKLLPKLVEKSICIGMIKHAHHKFDTDQPGKDSYQLRKAGAKRMLVSSSARWALIHELGDDKEATLEELIETVAHPSLDLILVEGFKHERFNKVELHRQACGHKPMYPQDPNIIAFVSDIERPVDIQVPMIHIDDIDAICEFIITQCQLTK